MLFIFLGCSGSGKSTIAKMMMKDNEMRKHGNWGIVDVDAFWKSDSEMPRITYKGKSQKLYDSIDSINWDAVGEALIEAYTKFDHVIFTTFVFAPELISLTGWYIIEFDISESVCIERRRISKTTLKKGPVDHKWFAYDEWMVKTHVTPFYNEWSKKLEKTHLHDYIGADFPLEIVFNLAKMTVYAYLPKKHTKK